VSRARSLAGTAGSIAAALAAMLPGSAEAHLATTRFGDFYGGALHLTTAPEHALALLALGLLTGLQDPRNGRWVIAAAPLGLLAGAAAAVLLPLGMPATAVAMALLTALGLLAALAWRVPLLPLAGLGLVVGLLHGYQNGLAVTEATVAVLFVLGIVAGGLVCLAVIAAGAVAARQQVAWGAIGLRAGGSWIAAIGVMMLGLGIA
jgi:urease accessory protein